MIQRNTPPGGDRRYNYIPYASLNRRDRDSIRLGHRYPYSEEWLPYDEYLYPVRKDGTLARAKRCMPHDRAKELYAVYKVTES